MSKYEKYDKNQLIKHIEELENQLRSTKYGLYWDKSIDYEVEVEKVKNEIPILTKLENIKIENAVDNHILIEGDNFHALTMLSMINVGRGIIDIIYIDPPYNTGAKNWRYNNNFVDNEDSFRHSKWLSMMDKRLLLAKDILKKDGALIVAIDENEVNNLGLLLKKIFGPSKSIDLIPIMHNPGGIQGNNFSYNHEYAYFVYPNKGQYITKEKRNVGNLTPFRDWGKENSKRLGSPNCFYPIFVKEGTVIGTGEIPPDDFHPSSSNTTEGDVTTVWPIDKNGVERRWRFAADTVSSIFEELVAVENKGVISIQREKKYYTRKTMWTDSKFNANIYGTQLLSKIISAKFPFPKSLHLVSECIQAVTQNKNAVILDFFAGSGTTGHAVLELNKEDGGNRRFILCTNNENGICTDVTFPRLKTVITGIRPDGTKYSDGIAANLQYFKCDFIPNVENVDQAKYNLVEKINNLICVEEDVFDLVELSPRHYIYQSNNKQKQVFMYIDYYEEKSFKEFKKKVLDSNAELKIVYMFSTDNVVDELLFMDIKGVEVKPIPSKIYEIYKDIVEDIKRG